MRDLCEAVRDALPDLVRAGGPGAEPLALAPDLEAHALVCETCRGALAGARALGARLSAWAPPEPSSDLVARTLARVRLARIHADREAPSARLAPASVAPAVAPPLVAPPLPPAEPLVALDRAHARRSSVELLAVWDVTGPRPRPQEVVRGRLGVRIAFQAAAAVLLFAACSGFAVTFYPVVVQALEESRAHACQERLARVGDAIRRYRHDHPASEIDGKNAYAIRDALVRGGYARESDFVCPSARSHEGAVSFVLRLPDAKGDPRAVVAFDRLGNHPDGLNVLHADGRVELVDEQRLAELLAAH